MLIEALSRDFSLGSSSWYHVCYPEGVVVCVDRSGVVCISTEHGILPDQKETLSLLLRSVPFARYWRATAIAPLLHDRGDLGKPTVVKQRGD